MTGKYRHILSAIYCHKRVKLALASLFCFTMTLVTIPVYAENTAAISQGFRTTEANLTVGALVSLVPGTKGSIEFANSDNTDQLIGVVGDKPLVSLSSGAAETQVVISGVTPTIVSDVNGDIKIGDKITTSPIDGIGMKATTSTRIIGVAQDDFSNIENRELTLNDRGGVAQKIRAGTLPVQVNVTHYAVPEENNHLLLPPFLQQLANSVAGREVPIARVVIALIILLAGFISTGILLYSSVQSSIISIGRNPLSESAVGKSMLRVGLTALGILLVMLFSIYFVLKT